MSLCQSLRQTHKGNSRDEACVYLLQMLPETTLSDSRRSQTTEKIINKDNVIITAQ
jgi:hypothetical protein